MSISSAHARRALALLAAASLVAGSSAATASAAASGTSSTAIIQKDLNKPYTDGVGRKAG